MESQMSLQEEYSQLIIEQKMIAARLQQIEPEIVKWRNDLVRAKSNGKVKKEVLVDANK